MKYAETYFRFNWPDMNELGFFRPRDEEVYLNPEACKFLKNQVTCPFCLAIITYMLCFKQVNAFSAMSVYKHFFGENDSRGNAFMYEMAIDKLFRAEVIKEVL